MNWPVLIMFVILSLIAFGIMFSQPDVTTTKFVKCYDHDRNIIVGQQCIETVVGLPMHMKLIGFFALEFGIGLITFLITFAMWRVEELGD